MVYSIDHTGDLARDRICPTASVSSGINEQRHSNASSRTALSLPGPANATGGSAPERRQPLQTETAPGAEPRQRINEAAGVLARSPHVGKKALTCRACLPRSPCSSPHVGKKALTLRRFPLDGYSVAAHLHVNDRQVIKGQLVAPPCPCSINGESTQTVDELAVVSKLVPL